MRMRSLSFVALALAAGLAGAAEQPKLKPFVLASRGPGEPAKVADEVRGKLEAAGFEVAGRYAPYDGAVVLVVGDGVGEALDHAAGERVVAHPPLDG